MKNSTTKLFYNKISWLYPLINLFFIPQKKKFSTTINQQPFGRLLEIGIGDGSLAKLYTNHQVTGIDIAENMLKKARKNVSAAVQLYCMSGDDLQFPDNSFDYIVLSHVVAVIDQPTSLFNEVNRVLKPNGKVFILNHFTPNNGLKYLDKGFSFLSGWLRFRSQFYVADVSNITALKLRQEMNVGLGSYFKILIYEKAL